MLPVSMATIPHHPFLPVRVPVLGLPERFVVVVDSTKIVERLNLDFLLPVEVLPTAWRQVQKSLEQIDATAELRMAKFKAGPVVTDQGNLVLDVRVQKGIDDPVGAVSVHGTCGIWGVLAIGLFSRYDDAFLGRDDAGLFYGGGLDQLSVQAVMVVIIVAWTAITAGIAFQIIKKTTGLRVSPEEEAAGLDISEHGAAGYHLDTTN